jgi:plastocyanin
MKNMIRLFLPCAAVSALLLLTPDPALAATYTVDMLNFSFSPPTRTIGVGDTVTWVNNSGLPHSSTGQPTNSPAEAFCGSGTFSAGTCSYTFNNPGSFGYFCILHGSSFGMVGTIIVTNAPNTPPSISLTNPISGAKFLAPGFILLQASASDTGGSVTNVQFFSGAALIGNKTSVPYNFTASNLAAGNYSFSARAFDNGGLSATSSAVNVFVLTNAILTSPVQLPDGRFHFDITGIAGQTYASESSSNLVNWIAFVTNVAPANTFSVTDSTSTNVLRRYYRARQDR